MELVVTPTGATAWSMPADELAAGVRAVWPDARVWRSDAPLAPGPVLFELRRGGELLTGHLDDAGSSVWFDGGPIGLVAELAVWFRRQAPGDVVFAFTDEGWTAAVDVPLDADPAVVAQRYEAG
jgi:hypothetical protein